MISFLKKLKLMEVGGTNVHCSCSCTCMFVFVYASRLVEPCYSLFKVARIPGIYNVM